MVKITESGMLKESELCTTYQIMFIVSEYYPTSLHKEIVNRKGRGVFFTE